LHQYGYLLDVHIFGELVWRAIHPRYADGPMGQVRYMDCYNRKPRTNEVSTGEGTRIRFVKSSVDKMFEISYYLREQTSGVTRCISHR
jgi:hypothetical protein